MRSLPHRRHRDKEWTLSEVKVTVYGQIDDGPITELGSTIVIEETADTGVVVLLRDIATLWAYKAGIEGQERTPE